MDKSNRNHSIKCTVSSCKYHCDNADYCALNPDTVVLMKRPQV